MSESIVIEVENRSELEALAHSKGYDTVQDYVLALIAVDKDADEDGDYDLANGLREAFRDIREGRIYPVESLWDMVEADDEEDDSDSSDEEGPRAPLTVGSSAEVDSHTPDPMAMSDSSVDVLAPLKVTIVSIIDPAISESEIFQPEVGNRFWAVEVLLEATGDKAVNSGEPWIVTDTDGNEYENMYLTGAAADVGEDITYSAIEPGQSKQGVVVFELPESAQVKSVSVNASIFVGGTLTFDAP